VDGWGRIHHPEIRNTAYQARAATLYGEAILMPRALDSCALVPSDLIAPQETPAKKTKLPTPAPKPQPQLPNPRPQPQPQPQPTSRELKMLRLLFSIAPMLKSSTATMLNRSWGGVGVGGWGRSGIGVE